ncbi:MAG: sigma-54 dependent transcriptional regulator [Bryobacteraceae bacterium]
MIVLVVDDDAAVAEFCRQVLAEAGHTVLIVKSGKDALAALAENEIDVVLSDVRMPDMDGVDLLRSISPGNAGPDVVLMTGYASISSAVEAIRLGAYDYLVKPFDADQLEGTLQRLGALRALRVENLVLRFQLDSERGCGGMIGVSPAMLAVFKALPRIAGKRQPVLITGETGTGKELVARAIHDQGPDRDRPFVAVDCGALSADIVESEIFGHVRGAFTGAIGDRPGLLASAANGTLFLDEVGELPLRLQAKFFRALQDREFRPLGGDAVRKFEGRVIAATNRDLEAAVRAGSFRPELYFRLCVHPVHVPPLRARRDDIPALIRHFIQKHGRDDVLAIAPDAVKELAAYHWPGNVRELENCILSMMANCEGRVLDTGDIPKALRMALRDAYPSNRTPLEDAERAAIVAALEEAGGNIAETARRLGIAKATLYRKMSAYALTPPNR